MQKNGRSAVLGLVLILPACLVCLSGLLGLPVPDAFIHPVLVMGGLLAALALNVLPVLSVKAHREDGSLVGSVSLRVEGGLPNLMVVSVSLLLAAVIALYLFLENFQPR